MRCGTILLLLAALAGCSPAGRAPTRGGIVSTNPCADAMLVELVPPERIAAISHYSQEPTATSIPLDLARRYHETAGTAEEVIALAPDLVVTSSFTPIATRAAYQRAGLKVLLLDSPTTVAASEAQITQLAGAVGAIGRGKGMIRRIEAALAEARPTDARPDPAALLYIGGNLVTGAGTLLDELMARAGLRDAADEYGLAHTGTLPLETIIDRPPDLIFEPDLSSRTAKLRAHVLAYRTRQALFPRRLVNCGGPTIIPAVETLAAARRDALR